MFLKRISLHGFKSFADRTEFDFGPGMACVVGPNGCGKSNILDAVRWVLGEQSAKSLRGTKMADVIFAGSRTRKPAHFAEVSLTFDNRSGFLPLDQEEVVVGRVLYTSGESEYRLNGTGCRLKDVRDLLLDTGVGVDAYSVIEQGRVDALLQASPIERREIFEEAAGISRYKVRRAEAQRKLERTQNNLLRLNDVVEELEKRLRSVRLAAGKARNFQQYDGRLRELRSAFSLSEYHELVQHERGRMAAAEGFADQLSRQRAALAARDAEAAGIEHEIQRHDERIQAGEGDLLALQAEISTLAERITQCERRIVDLGATRDRRLVQVREITGRAEVLDGRILGESEVVSDLAAAVARSQGRIDELRSLRSQAEQRCEGSRRSLEQGKAAAFEAVRRSSLLNNQRQNLELQQRRLHEQIERLVHRQQQLAIERERIEVGLSSATERSTALDQQSAALTSALQAVEADLAALRTKAENVALQIGHEKEERSAVASRLTLLEDMEQRNEGVDAGAQSILAWRGDEGRTGGVAGLVADCLLIDDPRVNVLQAVLSTFENHVVVRDTYAFLSELARRGELAGPAHVLALDRLPAEIERASYADAPGFVARASEWVRCEPEFARLAQHLLGRVIIVDVIERALALASSAPEGYTFVTIDGATISSGGRLTVGALRAALGLISRKAEIRQLQGELEEIENRLALHSRRRVELDQSTADVQLRHKALLGEIAGVQRHHAEARVETARLTDELLRTQREAALLEGDLLAGRRGLDESQEQQRRLDEESSEIGRAQQQHESQIDVLGRELAEIEAAVSHISQELTDALVEVGRAAERRSAAERTLAALQSQLSTLRKEREQAEHEASEAAMEIERSRVELQQTSERRIEAAALCERRQADLLTLREQRQELRRRVETCGAEARELHRAIEQIDAELHECRVALREYAVRKENLATRVRDELGLELAELYANYAHAEQDWEAIRAEIEELRGKIARLGNVNLDAIAELEELAPRFDNLVAQRSDLLSSIEQLAALIQELDDESRARFTKAFETIREHFQDLFRKLFGGGKADIILEQPENPLDCGIDIIARPPGKEPQSISLLSGGERTMTAVALLMAVFRSKPSPFAILDEVDAALDESNVGRFNNVLQEFMTQSQFIVITHSKRTMQCADVLYGITMEEAGVSKRVGVRFEERVQTPIVA